VTFHAKLTSQELAVPEIHRRVTDLSGTLSEEEQRQLERALQEFEGATSNQIVVLIVPSLEGESLEEYSLRVCEKNKLGKKGRDNGVLLFVAKSDRKLRIEVGYGLEGVLPDATANQIIRYEIVPHFKSGDYYDGVRSGVEAIMQATKGEYKGDGARRGTNVVLPGIVAFFVITILISMLRRGRRMFIGRRGYGGGPWFGGFGGGGFGGGSGGGFSSGGGGGFSGGGGSFGGGGASGSW
jgi:uncharacterized protein